VCLWRGTTIQELVCQLMGNSGDVLIGRQMPMHFSDRKVNSVAWSSVIGTQLPQAMGAAWAAKLKKTRDVIVGYIGDGGTSCGDFHAALNFAGVFQVPCVFYCRNNHGRSRCRSRVRPPPRAWRSRRRATASPACAWTATTSWR
jgi:pyruvate dehydrogenase E1 component alpha subunit/2-oxoisovalerate dehydrogenase E1 component alpha subunit